MKSMHMSAVSDTNNPKKSPTADNSVAFTVINVPSSAEIVPAKKQGAVEVDKENKKETPRVLTVSWVVVYLFFVF